MEQGTGEQIRAAISHLRSGGVPFLPLRTRSRHSQYYGSFFLTSLDNSNSNHHSKSNSNSNNNSNHNSNNNDDDINSSYDYYYCYSCYYYY